MEEIRALTAVPAKVQMINGEGEFSSQAQEFLKEPEKHSEMTRRSHCTVISIIGPQSSGKSYLLNSLFGTKFDVLNAAEGRKQRTKGIWIAKCIDHSMIIMDVEGLDGRERGEDGISFKRQTALFSLTVSDILLLNMWFHDISRRHQGTSLGLLKLIFEERTKIEAPKTTIVIVMRDYDYDEISPDVTKKDLKESIYKLWEKVNPAKKNRKMNDYIEVIVKDLPHKHDKKCFTQKSTDLANSICSLAASGSLEQMHYASGFADSSKRIWDLVRSNGKITSADHKLAMSSHMCIKIMEEILKSLDQQKGYGSLMSNESISVKKFNAKLLLFLKRILNRYEEETSAFDKNVRDERKAELEMMIVKRFEPIFCEKISSLLDETLTTAKSNIRAELDKLPMLDESAKDGVIKPYLKNFDDDSQADLHENLKEALTEHRKKLGGCLETLVNEEASSIQSMRNIKLGLIFGAKVVVGTAWAASTGDPSLLVSTLLKSVVRSTKRERAVNLFSTLTEIADFVV